MEAENIAINNDPKLRDVIEVNSEQFLVLKPLQSHTKLSILQGPKYETGLKH